MFKPKLPSSERGFTLVEALVAILLITVFVATAMQAVVIAAVFKARARGFSEATIWIQKDLENVRLQAAQLKYTTVKSIAGTNKLQVSSINGFEVGDILTVGSDSTGNEVSVITITPPTLTLKANSAPVPTPGVVVVATNKCKATSATTGFGKSLELNLPAISTSDTKTGATHTLTREFAVEKTPAAGGTCTAKACYELLQLTYNVKQGTKPPIATTYTEVIPDAALQCP